MNVECRMMNDEVPALPHRAQSGLHLCREIGGAGWGLRHSTFNIHHSIFGRCFRAAANLLTTSPAGSISPTSRTLFPACQ